jgi:cob(I)alamin adenosyltransferase
LARIYTRTGDKGETGLIGGTRVPKDSVRVKAYGNVDELNSVLGLARAFLKDQELDSVLEKLQNDLFIAGADLAAPERGAGSGHEGPRIKEEMITALEQTIDKFQEELPPLRVFILPSGGQAGAVLHFARAVARRAERSIVELSKAENLGEHMVPYMNRLSDLLFVIARVANHRAGISEEEWHASK